MSQDYKYEEEQSWKMARELAWDVYGVTSRGGFERDHRVRDSVRRASFAIMANVAEGIERGGTVEFVRYLGQAKDEIKELRLQLVAAQEKGYLSSASLTRIEASLAALGCVISGLMTSINQAFINSNSMSVNYQAG